MKSHFNWQDPFLLADQLSDEERAIVEQILADLPSASKSLQALLQPGEQPTAEPPQDQPDPEIDKQLQSLLAAIRFNAIRQEIQHGR